MWKSWLDPKIWKLRFQPISQCPPSLSDRGIAKFARAQSRMFELKTMKFFKRNSIKNAWLALLEHEHSALYDKKRGVEEIEGKRNEKMQEKKEDSSRRKEKHVRSESKKRGRNKKRK